MQVLKRVSTCIQIIMTGHFKELANRHRQNQEDIGYQIVEYNLAYKNR